MVPTVKQLKGGMKKTYLSPLSQIPATIFQDRSHDTTKIYFERCGCHFFKIIFAQRPLVLEDSS